MPWGFHAQCISRRLRSPERLTLNSTSTSRRTVSRVETRKREGTYHEAPVMSTASE